MVVSFRGGRTCECVATSLPWVEYDMIRKGLIKQSIDVFQWGYNGGGVAASAGTHDAGGCIDVNQYSDAQIKVWRDWGWAMQHRTPAQGFSHHAHGWPIGCPHLSAGARHQAVQWNNRTNGLASYGPITGPYTTENWRDALERNFYKMFTLSDIKSTMAGVIKDSLGDIAKAVLTQDGLIENEFTSNSKNTHVSLATALTYNNRATKSVADDNAKLRADVSALKAQVEKLTAGTAVANNTTVKPVANLTAKEVK